MEAQCVFCESESDTEYCLFQQIENQALEEELYAIGTGVSTTSNDCSMLVSRLVQALRYKPKDHEFDS